MSERSVAEERGAHSFCLRTPTCLGLVVALGGIDSDKQLQDTVARDFRIILSKFVPNAYGLLAQPDIYITVFVF